MTTIAFKNGIIAGDRLVSANGLIVGETCKIGKRGRILWGCAGELGMTQRMSAWLASGMEGPPPLAPANEERSARAMICVDDRVITLYSDGTMDMIKTPFHSIGSGSHLALGAMAAGKSAVQAVKIAATLDTSTGSKVDCLRSDE